MRYACAALAAFLIAASPVPAPSPTAPAIHDISYSPQPLRAGKPLSIVVHTTSDVTSIQGRVLAFRFNVPKVGNGTFAGSSRVPWWARFYHGTFHIVFTATNAAGAQSQMSETVRV